MRNRSLAAAAAFLLPALLLVGCAQTTVPLDQPDPDIPGGSGDGPVTGIPAVDDEFFATVEELRGQLDEWRDGWLASGCTDVAAVSGGIDCSLSLSGGGLVATSIQIVFGGTGIADFALSPQPQVADLADSQAAAVAAATSTAEWNDSGCPGETDPSCLAPTTAMVDDLMALHDALFSWSR